MATAINNNSQAGAGIEALDEAAIVEAVLTLTQPGQTVELRALGDDGGMRTGLFTDPAALADQAAEWGETAKGVYITLNPVRADLEGSARDSDILRRKWLPIDVDPVREKHTSSSDAEHMGALQLAQDIKTFLGWPDPVEIDSGNGAHLLYAIDLPNDEASHDLVQRALKALDLRFSTEQQQVDTGNFNASRIWKLPGTVARKGPNTSARPHRMARLLHAPEGIQLVTCEQLEWLASLYVEQREATPSERALDLAAWLEEHGVEVEQVKARKDMTVYTLTCCPWSEEHSDGERGAAIMQFPNGALGFKCHHAHCAERTWQEFRAYFEPHYLERRTPRLPDRYKVSAGKLVKLEYDKVRGEYERVIANAPVGLTARLVDVETGEEALRLAWQREGERRREVIVERGKLMDTRAIVGLASQGCPVNSVNARDVIAYLDAYEATNYDLLPVERVSGRMGWQEGDGFLWGRTFLGEEPAVAFQGKSVGEDQEAAGFHAQGSLEQWVEGISVLKGYPLAQFPLYAAFVSAMLPILDCPNFVVDLSNRTSTGKSTVMRVAASAAGKPEAVVHSWKTTKVGFETLASATTGLPLILDDTKTVRNPAMVGEMLYDHAQGRGSSRGSPEGMRFTRSWRSVMLCTGEGPAVEFSQDGGTRGRVLSLKGMPFGSDQARSVVDQLNRVASQHYGHAYPLFIRYLQAHREQWAYWRDRYREEVSYFAEKGGTAVASRLAQYFAAVTFTAELLHRALAETGCPLPWEPDLAALWKELAEETVSAPPEVRALEDVYTWACQHRSKFYAKASGKEEVFEPYDGWYGRWDGEYDDLAIQPLTLKKFLTEQGYRPEEVLGAWKGLGWLDLDKAGKYKAVRLPTGLVRLVVIKYTALEQHAAA